MEETHTAHDIISSNGCSDIVFERPGTTPNQQYNDIQSAKSMTTAATRAKNRLNLKKYTVVNKDEQVERIEKRKKKV